MDSYRCDDSGIQEELGEQRSEENLRVFNLSATGYGIKDTLPPKIKSEIDLEGVSGFIINLANNEELSYKDALAEIRRKTDSLSAQDYDYLINHSVLVELKEWAKKESSKKTAGA
jgi:hypothetical protein